MLYEITFDDRNGYAKCATRKRIDHAHDAAYKFAYDAYAANGLLDREAAHKGIAAIAKAFDDFKRFTVATQRTIDLGYPGIITIHSDKNT